MVRGLRYFDPRFAFYLVVDEIISICSSWARRKINYFLSSQRMLACFN